MSMVFPGDDITADSGETYRIERLMAYRGRADCTDGRCTRRGGFQRPDGTWEPGECFGWHCSGRDKPTSMMGHDCPTRRVVE